MPIRKPQTPDSFVPTPQDILRIVCRRAVGITLRQIAAEVWPDLPWSGTASATGKVREWQIAPRPGVGGNRITKATPAQWLADQLQDLAAQGLINAIPRDRSEVDAMAGLSWIVPNIGSFVPQCRPLPEK